MNLYLTADEIGGWTGGSQVVSHESQALSELGDCNLLSRKDLEKDNIFQDPWKWDLKAYHLIPKDIKLCVGYGGTFGSSCFKLKSQGAKISWTIAAHNLEVSKREHEALGINFTDTFPHLSGEGWKRYIEGYRLADVIICPSTVAAKIVRGYGPEFEKKDIRIVPHGVNIPEKVAPLPKQFVCGYLGAGGADKGLRYLFAAWKKLNYKDSLLIVAGKDSTTSWMRQLWNTFSGGNVFFAGFLKEVANFYNSISLFICPAATEGFNLEVLESMSFSRPILCSRGAGAQDIIPSEELKFDPCNVDQLAESIDSARKNLDFEDTGLCCREIAKNYTWQKVREQYKNVWKEMLNNG